ncbi:MAG TPA: VOC family protein [Acidimicrobiia bacterium]|nr:VOC family protein [Acidimicrobiia bacterium]
MDERPPVWIGHTHLAVADVDRSADFWLELGLREVVRDDRLAVLELRGGTHLLLLPGGAETDTDAPFDLMVEDLDATHADWQARGLAPSSIERGQIHDQFTVRDPDGYRVTVRSSHVLGPV